MRLGVNGRFLNAQRGGVQRFALEVVRSLARRADVTLFLPGHRPRPEIEGLGVETVRGKLPGHAWEQLELPGRARRYGVDVTLHPANAAPLFGGPHVVVLHDVLPLARPGDYTRGYRAWSRVAHVEAARRAAAVVTVSEWSAQEIEMRVGISRDRLYVVRQGAAPLDRPATPVEVADARRRLDLDGPYFVAVTGGDPRKGDRFLGELVRSSAPGSVPVVIVGGPSAHVHRSVRTEDDEAASIRRVGRVSDDDLRALYTGSIALLCPSWAEGFGRPALEALACGTRVVAGPYGAAREVLGDAADLVPLDPAAWREAMDSVAREDPRRRAARIAQGARRASRYRWDDTADSLLGVCRACLEGGS